jgi:hypothetical protein
MLVLAIVPTYHPFAMSLSRPYKQENFQLMFFIFFRLPFWHPIFADYTVTKSRAWEVSGLGSTHLPVRLGLN